MSSLSSIVRNASDTASPTLTPALCSSSAAARSFGFSLMLLVNYNQYASQHNHKKQRAKSQRTLARSYAARAFFMASESCSLSTSP